MPPDAHPVPGLRHSVPPPRPGTRLHFAWAAVWAVLCTLAFFPFTFVHALFRPGARTLHRWMVPWSRLILWGIGVRLRVEHRMTLDPSRPVVFVANHQNALDILTAAAGLPVPFGFTPKAALRRLPLIGAILRHTGNVFVDRSTPQRAARSLAEAGAEIRAGTAVLLFPEGERTWATALAPFLRGGFLLAVEAGVPLVPVALDGDVGLLDERHWASRPGVARLVVGPPLATAGRARRDVPTLMAEVRAWIARELGVEGGGEGERVKGGEKAPSFLRTSGATDERGGWTRRKTRGG